MPRILAILFLVLIAPAAHAQVKNDHIVYVGGALMDPGKTIVENLSHSQDHEAFVAAIKMADLEGVLKGEGPFTVFAPTTAAFDKLPSENSGLLKPENSIKIARIVNFHIIPMHLTMLDIATQAKAKGGAVTYKTLDGDKLTFVMDAWDVLWLTDDHENTVHITIPDIEQSNGIIHVVDTVLMPASVLY